MLNTLENTYVSKELGSISLFMLVHFDVDMSYSSIYVSTGQQITDCLTKDLAAKECD
jgi:hypothetical protein